MVERGYTGWIEIDAKGTLMYWNNPRNNYGLAVDVYDEDNNQLDARDFFYLQSCEAGKSVSLQALKN